MPAEDAVGNRRLPWGSVVRPSTRPLRGLLRIRSFNGLPHAERLSVMSSGLPWFAVSQDGIEDDDESAHASDESLLTGFAGGAQFGVVRSDDRIGTAGDQGGHIEGGAHGGAAAGDPARLGFF
jgi:hypothetical protein